MNAHRRYVKYTATGMYIAGIGRSSWANNTRCDVSGDELLRDSRCFTITCDAQQQHRGMKFQLSIGQRAYGEILGGIILSKTHGVIGRANLNIMLRDDSMISTASASIYAYSIILAPGMCGPVPVNCALCSTSMAERFATSRSDWAINICPRCFFQSVALSLGIYADQFNAYPR